jgi:hypothetical protein
MILNKKFSITLCILLLLIIVVSIFTKEIIFESFQNDDQVDYTVSDVDINAFKTYEDNSNNISGLSTNGVKCLARYNILLDNYKKSLNNVNNLMKKSNMPNSLYIDDNDPVSGINSTDLEKSKSCDRSYSVSDSYFFKNVAYDELYLNWLNINILRHFGANSCNNLCSNFLGVNFQEDESMDIVDDKSPTLVSLHHMGFYNSNDLNLPNNGDNDDFKRLSMDGGFKKFYRALIEDLYYANNYPSKRYFGVINQNNTHIAYLAKQTGELGLNKLIQGCAIANGGTNSPEATVIRNYNIIDQNNLFPNGVPTDTPNVAKSVNYIDGSYFDTIVTYLPTEENVISVFGFFV